MGNVTEGFGFWQSLELYRELLDQPSDYLLLKKDSAPCGLCVQYTSQIVDFALWILGRKTVLLWFSIFYPSLFRQKSRYSTYSKPRPVSLSSLSNRRSFDIVKPPDWCSGNARGLCSGILTTTPAIQPDVLRDLRQSLWKINEGWGHGRFLPNPL
jgi:hypothetical protein